MTEKSDALRSALHAVTYHAQQLQKYADVYGAITLHFGETSTTAGAYYGLMLDEYESLKEAVEKLKEMKHG